MNNRVPSGGAAGVSVVYPGTWDDWQGGDTIETSSPAITGISPTFVTAGGPAFTLTVSGSNFVSGSKVRWNGSDRVTTFVSATQLRAAILAADVATAGTASVTVFNPDGSLSNAMTFEIRGPQPAIISLSPSWGTAGGPSFTLIVDGSNFYQRFEGAVERLGPGDQFYFRHGIAGIDFRCGHCQCRDSRCHRLHPTPGRWDFERDQL